MYIKTLWTKNVKLLHDVDISFMHEGKPRMWTVLVGENGLCKTTLLQCIALAAGGADRSNQLTEAMPVRNVADPELHATIGAAFLVHPGNDSTQTGSDSMLSTVFARPKSNVFSGTSMLRRNGETIKMFDDSLVSEAKRIKPLLEMFLAHPEIMDSLPEDHRLSRDKIEKHLESINDTLSSTDVLREVKAASDKGVFVVGYGVDRHLPSPMGSDVPVDPFLNRLQPLFGRRALTGTGFADLFTPELAEEYVKALSTALVDLGVLPSVSAIELRSRGAVRTPDDQALSHRFEFVLAQKRFKIPTTWASQGYQSTVAWIADLIGQAYLEAGKPVPLDEMEGICLVDELDLHLHPRWQVKLVPALKRIFPRMQFVVTTHSPMLLPGFEQHEIKLLKLDNEGNVVVEEPEVSPKLMTGSEIYASFFDLSGLYPNDEGQWLRRYAFLANDPTRTEEEERELQELATKLHARGVDPGFEPVPRESP